MTVWRWRTSGVPESTAFMPLITKTVGTWLSYKYQLDGQPGTEAIPAPDNDIPRDRLFVGEGQASARDFGGAWFPQLWYQVGLPDQHTTGAFPAGGQDCGVRVYSDNQLPVPAVEPQRGTRRLGGGNVVQPYMDSYRRAQTQPALQPRNATGG